MAEGKNTYKILTINGSPHAGYGNTAKVIKMILNSMQSEDIDLELKEIYLSKENILPCEGCTRCFKKGDCSLKDKDRAEEIISLFYWADAIIVGSPVYVLSITAILKKFFERCARITHRPDLEDKYGIAVSTSAGLGGEEVSAYIAQIMGAMGIKVVGQMTATAFFLGRFNNPGEVNEKAGELGSKLLTAINEKPEMGLSEFEAARREKFVSLMGIPSVGKNLFKADYEYWENKKGVGEVQC